MERFDFENLSKERRKAIAQSIHTISVEELKKLGETLFPYVDDAWRGNVFPIHQRKSRLYLPSCNNERWGPYPLLP